VDTRGTLAPMPAIATHAGAVAAYRRADKRGDADGAFHVGLLLQRRGDLAEAEEAYRRADERGHADGANLLGVVLAKRGDPEGAEAAYRRADERGSRWGAFNVAVLLFRRRRIADARAALDRADDGTAEGAFRLGQLLRKFLPGHPDLAVEAFGRAKARGHTGASRELRKAKLADFRREWLGD
jgi:TPR repeat protein